MSHVLDYQSTNKNAICRRHSMECHDVTGNRVELCHR